MGIVSFWKISNFFHDYWSEFWEIFRISTSYPCEFKDTVCSTGRSEGVACSVWQTVAFYFEMLKIFLLEMIEIFVFDCVSWHGRIVKTMIKWFWGWWNHLWNISGHKWIEEQLNMVFKPSITHTAENMVTKLSRCHQNVANKSFDSIPW